jgi:glycosyltransferase involved in cell wall biosynthesis
MNQLIFLANMLGIKDSLLYWDYLLSQLKSAYPNLEIYTIWPTSSSADNKVKPKQIRSIKIPSLKHYDDIWTTYRNKIISPLFFFTLLSKNRIVCNEFHITTLYAILAKYFNPRLKILLLVETDPRSMIKSGIKQKYRIFITKKSDLILTNNLLGRNYLIEKLKAREDKILTMPYLTSNIMETRHKKERTDTVKLLYVGQLIERKNLFSLLECVKNISYSHSNIKLTIVGEGIQKNRLQLFVEKNDLNGIVSFTGKIPYRDLSSYYYSSDIFILSTSFDYRALVGFEALSSGLAIITTIYDGARFEIVEENKNGFIIDPYNIDDFTSKIKTLIEDKVLLDSFKRYSIEKSKEYTKEICSNNLICAVKRLHDM